MNTVQRLAKAESCAREAHRQALQFDAARRRAQDALRRVHPAWLIGAGLLAGAIAARVPRRGAGAQRRRLAALWPLARAAQHLAGFLPAWFSFLMRSRDHAE